MVRWISLFVVVLVIGFFAYIKMNNQPPEDLGVSPAGLLKACPTSPNCVSSQADKADTEHYIDPIIYHGNRKDTQLSIESYFLDQGNAEIVASELGYVHIQVTSSLMGFVDDLEFYLPAADSVVHIRSASRVGHSDLNVNRDRIEKLKSYLGD